MEWTYWKVVIRYGHVGNKNEVSVARYLVMPGDLTIVEVMNTAADYLKGKRTEKESLFLQQLFAHAKAE